MVSFSYYKCWKKIFLNIPSLQSQVVQIVKSWLNIKHPLESTNSAIVSMLAVLNRSVERGHRSNPANCK